jgi:hypothetical protein
MEAPVKAVGLRGLIGKRVNKTISFMGSELEINKLTVGQVTRIQGMAKEAEKDESKSLDILKEVIRIAVVGAADFTDEEFSEFPIGELTTLSNEIMSFSGLGNAQPEGKLQA